jgi:hypothetical protein
MHATHRTRTLRVAVAALLLASVGAAVTPASAETRRFQRVDPRARQERLREARLQRSQGEAPPVAHLKGTLRWDSRDGLTLGGTSILVDLKTGLFPTADEDRGPIDERALDGKPATVFGRRTLRGVRASLIVVKTDESDATHLTSLLSGPRVSIPAGGDDPAAEVMLPDAPR